MREHASGGHGAFETVTNHKAAERTRRHLNGNNARAEKPRRCTGGLVEPGGASGEGRIFWAR